MTPSEKRRNLGRGLSALLGDDTEDYARLDQVRSAKTVPIEHLHPGRYQPRHRMGKTQINELAQSVAEKGILQPILVRRRPNDPVGYEIIAGERRWRAAQIAKMHEVPVVIREFTDQEALEIALVENLQRQDLSALEEAEAYKRLMDEFGHSQEILARSVGKSRSHVANTLRLLGLPDPVRRLVDDGTLSAGHARALLGTDDPAALASKVVKNELNVRQTERLAAGATGSATRRRGTKSKQKDSDTIALERELATLLGVSVEIRFDGVGGALVLTYRSPEQLDDILHRLTHGAHDRPGETLAPEPVPIPQDPGGATLAQSETAEDSETDGTPG